jgi:hypothetical protein
MRIEEFRKEIECFDGYFKTRFDPGSEPGVVAYFRQIHERGWLFKKFLAEWSVESSRVTRRVFCDGRFFWIGVESLPRSWRRRVG